MASLRVVLPSHEATGWNSPPPMSMSTHAKREAVALMDKIAKLTTLSQLKFKIDRRVSLQRAREVICGFALDVPGRKRGDWVQEREDAQR